MGKNSETFLKKQEAKASAEYECSYQRVKEESVKCSSRSIRINILGDYDNDSG